MDIREKLDEALKDLSVADEERLDACEIRRLPRSFPGRFRKDCHSRRDGSD